VTLWLRVRAVVDRIIAAVASLLAAPVIGILALLVRRDGGPGLITVPRVGRDGTIFGMWKIRSMRSEGAGGHATGSGLTSEEDDRITPMGRRIRSLHLDELPQLFNVAKGEMTLLGPRPEAPRYVDLDDERWRRVLQVAPGIAGPTQLIVGDWERDVISGPGGEAGYRDEVVPVKLAIDEWYVTSASPRLDLLVITTLMRHTVGAAGGDRLRSWVQRSVEAANAPIAWSHRNALGNST
jgi:lipopolysaccharide/colanic/teichoic acid biosynthesis glycosyltransferase